MSEAPAVYVLDLDCIVDGSALRMIADGSLRGRILVHSSIVDYLYSEARRGRSAGYAGLSELTRLMDLISSGVEIVVVEEDHRQKVQSLEDLKSIVRRYAWRTGGILVTSDPVQARAARALGVSTVFTGRKREGRLKLEEYFDGKTMSVHLKEGVQPLAKVGRPGNWMFVSLSDKPLTRHEIEEIAREVVEASALEDEGFIEIDRSGSTIVQLRDYRIVITRPPLSDGWEITAVRPVAKLRLEDYEIPDKLYRRLLERAEGILIAGAPGMGKTTFAQALASFYSEQGKVVKTIESPRDMRLPPNVTQYSKNYADLGELHDILLLSRPDYTVYDELRSDEDFQLYVDLRLAGIGMIGVVHATTPIDAVQRFLRRVELGMIPSIVDTVIFIDAGEVSKVYELAITVKLPTGLREADLSRPVVEVRDFISGELEYEIYTFGEQTMVVPVRGRGRGEEAALLGAVRKLLPDSEVEVRDRILVVRLPSRSSKVTARRLKRVKKLAEKHGYDVRFMPL
ncbi:MAG: PINc/VapC family ATPase [Aeropyrum sp.]|nr:PINc/VapC family ATPase [Aeropyrum sp.]MCE4616162.1 PINc/VapC family ATPase [Aeropyrum sp.]